MMNKLHLTYVKEKKIRRTMKSMPSVEKQIRCFDVKKVQIFFF